MTAAGGEVVLVATPIGNLGDLSPRAVATLRAAHVLCCEDTRRTRALLSAAGVPAGGRLLSLHAHNEMARLPRLLALLAEGKTIAVVSDAGTPGVSDPGGRLAAAALEAGARVSTVPGPSAVLAGLAVSGLRADRFCFEGFLPRKGADRRRRLDSIVADERTTVFFEAPNRLAATLADLARRTGERQVAVCRELTKVHEEGWHGTLADAALAFDTGEVRGEVVVVVGGAGPGAGGERRRPDVEGRTALGTGGDGDLAGSLAVAVAAQLDAGKSARDAAAAVAADLGLARRRAYDAVVAEQRKRRIGGGKRGEPPR